MAVFYRTNAQSRMLEDMLLRAGVPYRIVGGTRFFDRAEIRDVMAYLTLVVNPADDIAAKRVVNVPRRGVGKSTVERVEQFAREMDMPFLDAAELAIVDPEAAGVHAACAGGVRRAAERGAHLCGRPAQGHRDDHRQERARHGLGDWRTPTRPVAAWRTSRSSWASWTSSPRRTTRRIRNTPLPPTEGADRARRPVRVLRGDSLADFIEWVRLRTDLDTMTEDGNAVTLMTVHSSKGLEFDCVFVAGMEETLFPHMNSVGDAASVEEERRLAYVAITRARKRLYLTCAQQRQIFGQTSANPVSRFIQEIPPELRSTTGVGSAGFSGTGWEKRGSRRGIAGSGTEAGGGRVFGRSSASGSAGRSDRDRGMRGGSGGFASGANPNAGKKAAAKMAFAVGDTVDHKTFGRGRVVKVDGDSLHIKFARTGQTKKLLKDYAPIVKINQ